MRSTFRRGSVLNTDNRSEQSRHAPFYGVKGKLETRRQKLEKDL